MDNEYPTVGSYFPKSLLNEYARNMGHIARYLFNRAKLTKKGKKFLEKYSFFKSLFIMHLPFPFTKEDIVQLIEHNPQYTIYEIIFSLFNHNWIKSQIKDNNLLSINNFSRYMFLNELKEENYDLAVKLYQKSIREDSWNFNYIKELNQLYSEHNDFINQKKLIYYSFNKFNNLINFKDICDDDLELIYHNIDKINSLIKRVDNKYKRHLIKICNLIKEFKSIEKFDFTYYVCLENEILENINQFEILFDE